MNKHESTDTQFPVPHTGSLEVAIPSYKVKSWQTERSTLSLDPYRRGGDTGQTAVPKIGDTGKHQESWVLKADSPSGTRAGVETAGDEVMNGWGLCVDDSEGSKLQGDPVARGLPPCWDLLPRAQSGSHSEHGRKVLPSFQAGGEEEPFWNTAELSALLNKACPQEKLLNHSRPCWGFSRA